MVLRTSRFFGYCYADELSEKAFYAKNFIAEIKESNLKLSFTFVKGLDLELIKLDLMHYTFFEIQDIYLKNKLIKVLNEFPQVKRIQFLKAGEYVQIVQLKITTKGFLFKLV